MNDSRPTRYKRPPKTDIDYGQVIKDTLALVWRHKFLWFFGFFAGTASAFGGWSCDYNSYFTTPGEDESETAREAADVIFQWVQDHLTLIIAIAAIGVIVSILVWLWSVFCHGAVIASVRDINRKQPVSFGTAFQRGKDNFRRLLPFMLLVALAPMLAVLAMVLLLTLFYILLTALGGVGEVVGIILLTLLGAVIFATIVSTLGFFAFIGIWPVLGVVLFVWFNYGSRFVVLSELRPIAALRNGARLLLDNLAKTAMLFIISVGISIGSTIVMVFAFLLAAIPAIVAWIFAYDSGFSAGGTVIALLLSLPPVIMTILFTAALNTYFASYWTDAWMLFTGEKKQRPLKAAARKGS